MALSLSKLPGNPGFPCKARGRNGGGQWNDKYETGKSFCSSFSQYLSLKSAQKSSQKHQNQGEGLAELKDIPLGSHKLEKIRIIPSELVKYSLTDSLTSSPFCPGGPGFPWKKSERNFHQNENRSSSFGSIKRGREGRMELSNPIFY